MKIGLFTDPHYSSQEVTCQKRYNSRSLQKIKAAYADFYTQGCALVICLGDLIDRENDHREEIENLRAVSEAIHEYPMQTIAVMGNHDAFCFTQEEFYRILGESCRPHTLSIENKSLVFIDACHFRNGQHYSPGHGDWRDTCFPYPDALKAELNSLPSDAILLMHQNIDPDIRGDHRLSNADELRTILEASGHVRTVYQGHYHPGNRSEHNGVSYITLPAMCEHDNAYTVVDL